jgi:UDP-N-acetylmuramyl tripeptide synthase
MEVRSGFADITKAQVILDRQEAIQWALGEAQDGDVVLIAGMGEAPHTPIGPAGELANDSTLVREALRSVPFPATLRLAA